MMKQAYRPKPLPLESIDWVCHISLIAEANAALARYDGILQTMVNKALFGCAAAGDAVV